MKKLLFFSILLMYFFTSVSAQEVDNWAYDGVFPPDSSIAEFGTNGIVVTEDGKVWILKYSTLRDSLLINGTPTAVGGIRVYNPDGTKDTTILIVRYGFEADTLGGFKNPSTGIWSPDFQTGLTLAADGNVIVASRYGGTRKIDYKTYEGLLKAKPGYPNGQSKVAVDDAGNVYVYPIYPGFPIYKYNSDLEESSKSIAVAETPGFCWGGTVTPDGNTLVHTSYTNYQLTTYTRPNIFSQYTQVDSLLEGIAAESSTWDPKHGHLWVSAGPADGAPEGYTPHAFYGIDWETKTVVDSVIFQGYTPFDPFKHRALAFSPSGDTLYVTQYDGTGNNIQRFVRIGDPVSVEDDEEIVSAVNFQLAQNYPNPFNPETTISFSLPTQAQVTIKVYNAMGQEIRTLTDRNYSNGFHKVRFNAANLASGLYLYQMEAVGVDGKLFKEMKKMMFLK
ncbi:MAG: T9SS type A sorting domain-containing protein [Melioribacteraceae bacterium]|nr:T9SS type A sorting domain-containing protein [Melioribacteraceae bacterium]